MLLQQLIHYSSRNTIIYAFVTFYDEHNTIQLYNDFTMRKYILYLINSLVNLRTDYTRKYTTSGSG